ncbi:MHC class II antigen presentation inhibitor [Raccoonpox virus]|uniref:MHC class II antigen presentation inhibitor n=1 Tax=Raccoon poxvirus TaxID=10256 RepID=A0A0G3FXU2_RACVI|nr:MHC class II antigen presentation inhibitor [Raccoonpox virus]AKJ93785.1 MHC class II antigen presentation inhibitor [Raccoonpox virus]AOP31417.1 MHC class II antigen presentation inhibitor [Raccoonpox virus]
MDAAFVITPMGVLAITDTLYDDLEISILDFIGPYIIGTIKTVQIDVRDIRSSDMQKCYFSYKGKIVPHNSNDLDRFNIYSICAAYKSKGTIIIACDYDIMLNIEGKQQPFYLFPSIDVFNATIIEAYNLYTTGDYHLIINPSDDLKMKLSLNSAFCISDGRGWIIIDGKCSRNFLS